MAILEIDVSNKNNLCVGMLVDIVADEDKATQKLTRGYIQEVVTKTNKANKITVLLTSGKRGIVKHIVTQDELRLENFKFYNVFFHSKVIYSIWDKKANKYLVIDRQNRQSDEIEKTAFLFIDECMANSVLTQFNNKDYMLRSINRKKPIVENFKTLDVQFFSIDKGKKLSYQRLVEWEYKFKNM